MVSLKALGAEIASEECKMEERVADLLHAHVPIQDSSFAKETSLNSGQQSSGRHHL